MERYEPPYHITNTMLALVAEIAEKTGRIASYRSFEAKPHLRRNNRIRSIHSSLAIEANSLSMDEVKGVIDGKTVIGPQKEIQEVKNAYEAYDMLGSFDPYSLKDIQKLHGVMTYLTVQESRRAWQKILCKRYSTSSRVALWKQGGIWRTSPWRPLSRECGAVCAP